MIWFAFVAVGLFCLGAGFVLGTAYGIQQEVRSELDRQRMLRSLKRMENR